MRVTAGYGDPVTWGPCMGHPNDPRTDAEAEEAAFVEYAYKQCLDEEEKSMFDAWRLSDDSLLPSDAIKRRAQQIDGIDIVFALFPCVQYPLKDCLERWASMIREEKYFTKANNEIKDILFEKGRENLVQHTEQSHRYAMSKILEKLNEGEVFSAYNKSVDLFNVVAKEIAKRELIALAEELFERIEDKWTHGGREDFLEGCWDE